MYIYHKCSIDLRTPGPAPTIEVMQGDQNSRDLTVELLSGHAPWEPPDNTNMLVLYEKSDGKCGQYDTMPHGLDAVEWDENILTVRLAPQVLTTPGPVRLAVRMICGGDVLHTVCIHLLVNAVPGADCKSMDYFSITNFVPQPMTPSQRGKVLQVTRVDYNGRIVEVAAAEDHYYIPTVTQQDSGSIILAFAPTQSSMAAVEPVTVTLPAGPRGHTALTLISHFAGSFQPGDTLTADLSMFNRDPQLGDVFFALDDSGNFNLWEVTDIFSQDDITIQCRSQKPLQVRTPQKGVDYFTQADKDELVAAVLAALDS